MFTPGKTTIRGAPRLCLCKEFMDNYGSCKLFREYEMIVHQLNKTSLRSETVTAGLPTDEDDEDDEIVNFLVPGTICAVAANVSSSDTVWF